MTASSSTTLTAWWGLPERVGEFKVDVAGCHALRSATAQGVMVRRVPHCREFGGGVPGGAGLRRAVQLRGPPTAQTAPEPHGLRAPDSGDRRWDSGAAQGRLAFRGVNWQVQTTRTRTALPDVCGRAGLHAGATGRPGPAGIAGYIEGLPNAEEFKASENVFTFSSAVASMEVLQLVALTTKLQDFGVQRFDFFEGHTRANLDAEQGLSCQCKTLLTGTGDTQEDWFTYDLGLQEVRL